MLTAINPSFSRLLFYSSLLPHACPDFVIKEPAFSSSFAVQRHLFHRSSSLLYIILLKALRSVHLSPSYLPFLNQNHKINHGPHPPPLHLHQLPHTTLPRCLQPPISTSSAPRPISPPQTPALDPYPLQRPHPLHICGSPQGLGSTARQAR